MTNTELLNYKGSDRLLTSIESQRRYLLRCFSYQEQCPVCSAPQNQFEGMHVAVDAYDFHSTAKKTADCVKCQRPLLAVVPMQMTDRGGWHWVVDFARENSDTPCRICQKTGSDHYYEAHNFAVPL